MIKMIVERDAAGFQIGLHAIGDKANRIALDGFEAANQKRQEKLPKQDKPKGGLVSGFSVYTGVDLRKNEFKSEDLNGNLYIIQTPPHRTRAGCRAVGFQAFCRTWRDRFDAADARDFGQALGGRTGSANTAF